MQDSDHTCAPNHWPNSAQENRHDLRSQTYDDFVYLCLQNLAIYYIVKKTNPQIRLDLVIVMNGGFPMITYSMQKFGTKVCGDRPK